MWYTLIIKGKELMTMLKTGDVKCPTCGGALEEHDCIDIEVDTDRVRLFKVGECPYCGNHYQWHEEFTYEGYTTPEETAVDDEPADIDDDCGFDPYEGCYTYDC